MNDESFAKLLEYFNLSWSGYRKVRKGVKKRIVRHMQSVGVTGIQAYLSLLDRDREIKKHCEKLMTVSISRFFRDKHLWHALEREIMPGLFTTMPDSEPFRVWSCGCARGEEAYSFKEFKSCWL